MAHFLPLSLTVASLVFVTSGCQAPAPSLPTQLTGLPTEFASLRNVATEQRQDLRSNSPEMLAQQLGQWWEVFNDPVLNELVSLTISANWDLQTALERIEIASARVAKMNAQALPMVYGQATGSRQQLGTTNMLDGLGLVDTFGFNLSVSWEPDVFGRIAAQTQAAQFDLEAVQSDRRALMVSIVAELVVTYAQLRVMQDRLRLQQRYVKLSADQVSLTKELVLSGLAPAASVARIQRDYLRAQSAIPMMQANIDVLISACAVLSGGYPRSLDHLLKSPGPLLQASVPLPETLPSQLLKQRPDIVSQEKVLLASLSGVDVAKADFMPQFIIPLSTGFNTSPFNLLLNPASFIWSIGASVFAPIYTGDLLEANLRIAKATNKADQQQYENIVRQALKEVEDAILEYQAASSELSLLESVRKQQLEIVAQEHELLKTGISPVYQLNAAELSLVQTQVAIIQARYAQSISLASLYKALGGGWSDLGLRESDTSSQGKS